MRKGIYFLWKCFQSGMHVFPYLFRWGMQRQKVTEHYPDPISCRTPNDLPPRSRGILFNDIELCTGCGECQKICPTQCLTVEVQPGAVEGRWWVSRFDIDLSRCVFCGSCVEVCEPGSLSHTKNYEAASYTLSDLVAQLGRGEVTVEQQKKWELLRREKESNSDEGDLF